MKALLSHFMLASIAFIFAATAQAETTKCKAITKIPTTISTSGVYCFTKDLSSTLTTGNAISINIGDVTLDMNGHVLTGESAGTATQASGISVNTQSNVTIKNGTVRGFETGVYFGGTSAENDLIENVTVDSNKVTGIYMYSIYGVVRNNRVTNTGGSSQGPNIAAFGICAPGNHTRILDNSVSGVASEGTGLAMGIGCLIVPNHLVVRGNMVTDVISTGGASIGIYFYGGANNIVSNNQVADIGDVGIDFDNSGIGAYMDNLVVNTVTAYVGGTAAGSTNF